MKYLVILFMIAVTSPTFAEDLTSKDYQASLNEANAQTGLIAQRAQALSAQLSHANDVIATLTSQLAEAKKAAAPTVAPTKDTPK